MVLKLFIRIVGHIFILLGVSIIIFTYMPIIYGELSYNVKKFFNPAQEKALNVPVIDTGPDAENIVPYPTVDEYFSVVIPKIEVNAPIVKGVSTVNSKEYIEALRYGVAHAKGTSLPGQNGNTFLFAHSSLNFWQLGPYATVFNLLHQLEKGDIIIIYYQKQPYVYRVYEKEIVSGFNTEPFDIEYDQPVVTLITCDPPGSTINRLVVKARAI